MSASRGRALLQAAAVARLRRAASLRPLGAPNSLLRRHKSSLPAAVQAHLQHDHHLEPATLGNVLEVADWAKNAYVMEPRTTLENTAFSPLLEPSEAALDDADVLVNRVHIADEDVDKWLANFEIPAEELAKCQTDADVRALRRLYARQLRLECSIYEMAVRKREASLMNVNRLGLTSNTNAAKSLILNWMVPATEFIEAEQRKLRESKHSLDSNTYGPAFLMLKPDVLAATGINVMLNQCLMETRGTKFIKLALAMGKAVQEEIIDQKEKRGDNYLISLRKKLKSDFLMKKVSEYHDDLGLWDKRVNLKVGAALIDCIQRSCFVPEGLLIKESGSHAVASLSPTPAFAHDYVFERNRRAGVIKVDKLILNTVLNTKPSANVLPWTARYLPMLVPPKKWEGVANGGYLRLHTKIMRQRDSAWQMDCVKRGEMDELLKSLNLLSEVPWVVNKEVLDVVLKIWESGGGFGDLPQRWNLETPEWKEEYENDKAMKAQYDKMVRKIQQRNQELHSLRCDTLYKLQVAEEFKDEEAIYFPYNMDFRGRVYPIPPNLNHLGSDLSRSLLVFRDRKPLGKSGLRWLKIHLANVFGVDKCSFDERVAFTEANLDKVFASARDPLGDGENCGWWKDADYPFLALGVCFELKRALESPNPEEYMSNVPVHQDGSCNGLQHYAALGRDLSGGQQVNLVPAPRPSDVYTGVATQVMRKVEQDAAIELPEYIPPMEDVVETDSAEERARKAEIRELWNKKRRKTHAQFLLGTISRKVVKQTVMTSVYGVTYIGARKQIMARLEEVFLEKGQLMDSKLEDQIYHASCYAAEVTMESMGDLFTSARAIMEWLADCASKVAQNGQAMSWITPLGLPVVQPYRKNGTQQVRTKVQHVLLVLSEQLPVSNGRQKSAFPPNFVHSLDSTHMLMTARRVLEEDKIAFAAVHDSYWTHASTVEVMNQRLREEFVNLYEQPLLENLADELRLRFPNTKFKDLPKTGDLDLKVVLNSPYFFN
ncbi:hypothetical protein P43SY_000026 [Pythium insidiosum]|uniref:DNA-directed RNA polymerase n=1 Tax=Pythium insidiosum TaxID=114742 RepID=A0AAD5M505_PYTIN|nr:hypothetical protein P43SY_000026 [Pythium insidiosum]